MRGIDVVSNRDDLQNVQNFFISYYRLAPGMRAKRRIFVDEMRRAGMSYQAIADEFGVTRAAIQAICKQPLE